MSVDLNLGEVSRPKRAKRSLLGAFFGLFFLLPGLLIMGWGFLDAGEYIKMQTWQAVPGVIETVDLNSSSDSDGGTTYKTTATYRYHYMGDNYTGNRASLYDDGYDNIGSFHHDIANKLEDRLNRGGSTDVYINPNDPSDSILIRDFRWGFFIFKFIFGLIFAGVGALVVYTSLTERKSNDLDAQQSSDAPWLANSDWTSPEITSSAKGAVWGTALFALFWNGFSIPMAILITPEILNGEYMAAIAYLFPLAGTWLAYLAGKTYLEYRRYGKTIFTMDPFPGAMGGQVGGTIDLKGRLPAGAQYIINLANVHSYLTGGGKNRSRRENILWEKSVLAYAEPYLEGTRLTFSIDVPSDSTRASDAQPDSSNYHLWRLNLHSDVPGVDLDRNFQIPVYPSENKSRHISHRILEDMKSVDADFNKAEVIKHLPLRQGVQGMEMYFPYFRNIAMGLGGIVFAAIFLAVAYFTQSEDAPMIFPIVFGFFGVLILWASFYSMTNSLRVYSDGIYLYTIRKWMGLPFKKSLLISEIEKLDVKSTSRQTAGNKYISYYKVVAADQSGKSITLAEGLPGRSVAEYARDEIKKSYNLKSE